ncbi:MAG: winged helix-turn-helix domain-containing protein [Acidobacteria bacterium]|nr:winged helix-turn-helix domain-containing protein [Acidobacteriota bacterium]
MKTPNQRTASFGPYTLDLRSGELRKFGTKVKMGEQAFQILRVLLEASGELVTREELRSKLWPDDTFVDFDHGLNSAVQRLRDCLTDSAEKPRWIETVPRRGYRFVGQVEWTEESRSQDTVPGMAPGAEPVEVAAGSETHGTGGNWGRRSALAVVVASALILVGFLTVHEIRKAQATKRAHLIRSLAVLPLDNFSGDSSQEYFADGMTDEVITMLAKNPALRVISRTSVMQYKGVHRPLPEIAKELGVDGILEGSVGRSGSRVHMTAQLIHAATDTHVWAETFDRDLSDVGTLQNELAEAIARQVGTATSIAERAEKKINPEAHDAYLLGRYYWFAGEYAKSRPFFQKAVDIQPDYAAGWSGLSDAYCANAASGEYAPDAVMPLCEAAAKRAVELDDSLSEAHTSVAANYLFHHWDVMAAERESAKAVALNPNNSQAHELRSNVLVVLHRYDESIQETAKAMELDPFADPAGMVAALLSVRRFDEAIKEARIRIAAQPNLSILHGSLADAYLLKGMEEESEVEFERAVELDGEKERSAELRRAFRAGGMRAALAMRAESLKRAAAHRYVSPLDLAVVSARIRNKEDTLRYLEESYQKHAPFLIFIQQDATFDFVRNEPRYRAIVQKMGLPPA